MAGPGPNNFMGMGGQQQWGQQFQQHPLYHQLPPFEWTDGLVVPQTVYRSVSHVTAPIALADAPIRFYVGSQRRGIRVSDAVNGNFAGLEGADQRLDLPDAIIERVQIRLCFQGYEAFMLQAYIRDHGSNAPKTRAHCANKVAFAVKSFVDEVVSGKRLPTSQDAWPFGIGPNNVRIEDMYITKLYHRSVGSFQPEIRWCTGIP